MDHRVDQSLEPGVLRNKRHVSEETSLNDQCTSARLKTLNLLSRLEQLVRDGAFDMYVLDELLSSASAALATSISEHANERLGKMPLRMFCKKKTARDRERVLVGETPRL